MSNAITILGFASNTDCLEFKPISTQLGYSERCMLFNASITTRTLSLAMGSGGPDVQTIMGSPRDLLALARAINERFGHLDQAKQTVQTQ